MEGRKIRNNEIAKDKKLNIKTTGLREWRNKPLYNRTESTPYRAIKELFNRFKLTENDTFVDFGSGKGRVCFYINKYFDCNIKGIEAKPLTFDDALYNLDNYIKNRKDYNDKINFIFTTAENYPIEKEDNVFYFFNPFSIIIFKQVLSNILKSFKKHQRELTLILFYPMEDFRDFIEQNTPFILKNVIKVPNQTDRYQRFLIYKLKPSENF